VILDLKN
jgi:hypothetical protein